MITSNLSASNVTYISSNPSSNDFWYQDCGCTQHLSPRKDWKENYTPLQVPEQIMIGDATMIEGVGVGDVRVQAYDGQVWSPIVLKNVLYTPKIPFNLFSVTTVLDKGYYQQATADFSYFKNSANN